MRSLEKIAPDCWFGRSELSRIHALGSLMMVISDGFPSADEADHDQGFYKIGIRKLLISLAQAIRVGLWVDSICGLKSSPPDSVPPGGPPCFDQARNSSPSTLTKQVSGHLAVNWKPDPPLSLKGERR